MGREPTSSKPKMMVTGMLMEVWKSLEEELVMNY